MSSDKKRFINTIIVLVDIIIIFAIIFLKITDIMYVIPFAGCIPFLTGICDLVFKCRKQTVFADKALSVMKMIFGLFIIGFGGIEVLRLDMSNKRFAFAFGIILIYFIVLIALLRIREAGREC